MVGIVINPAERLAWKLLAPNAPIPQTSGGPRDDGVSNSPTSSNPPPAPCSHLLEPVSTAVTQLESPTILTPVWVKQEAREQKKYNTTHLKTRHVSGNKMQKEIYVTFPVHVFTLPSSGGCRSDRFLARASCTATAPSNFLFSLWGGLWRQPESISRVTRPQHRPIQC